MNVETSNAVVVGLDGSDLGRHAVDYAAELAGRRHLPLCLTHTFERAEYGPRPRVGWDADVEGIVRRAAQGMLDDAVETLVATYPDLQVSYVLKVGSPIETLLEQSRTA